VTTCKVVLRLCGKSYYTGSIVDSNPVPLTVIIHAGVSESGKEWDSKSHVS
jgi:hypothetical protein